jgi:hypothetical protein
MNLDAQTGEMDFRPFVGFPKPLLIVVCKLNRIRGRSSLVLGLRKQMFLEMATVQPEASRKEHSNEVWSTRYRGDRLHQFASVICLGPVYSGKLLTDLQTFDPCMAARVNEFETSGHGI